MTRQIVGSLSGFEIRPAEGLGEFEIPRAGANEGGHVASAPEKGSEIVTVGADVKSFGAVDAKSDDGQGNLQDLVFVDANPTRGTIDGLAFTGQFVERDAVFLDGGDHRRDLVELAREFLEGRLNLGLVEVGHGFAFKNFSGGILGVGGLPELKGALVLLVLGHKQVLDTGGPTDHQHEQTGGNGIESPAVADFALTETAADEVDNVVGSAARGFVDQKEAVELGDHFAEKIAYRLQVVAYEAGV